jgi:hypothetical protein
MLDKIRTKNGYRTIIASIILGIFLLFFVIGKSTLAQNYQIDQIRGNVYRYDTYSSRNYW